MTDIKFGKRHYPLLRRSLIEDLSLEFIELAKKQRENITLIALMMEWEAGYAPLPDDEALAFAHKYHLIGSHDEGEAPSWSQLADKVFKAMGLKQKKPK